VHYSRSVNFYHSYGDRGRCTRPITGRTTGTRSVPAWSTYLVRRGRSTKFSSGTRAGAWPLLSLTRLYEITIETRYLEAARHIVQFMRRNRGPGCAAAPGNPACVSAARTITESREFRCQELFLAGVRLAPRFLLRPELKTLGPRPRGPAFGYGDRYNSGGPLMSGGALGYAYRADETAITWKSATSCSPRMKRRMS
jgi:hypothetical protein